MSLNNYLSDIKSTIGPERYAYLERRAQAAYDAFTRQAMHSRQRRDSHDPHRPRSGTIGALIVAAYEMDREGHGDVLFTLGSEVPTTASLESIS